jgi:hypothetical protein
MSERHDESNDKRDLDLDDLLAPLRTAQPGDLATARWQKAIQSARTQPSSAQRWGRRVLEWAVAASIGFGVATTFSKSGISLFADPAQRAIKMTVVQQNAAGRDESDKNYFDMDATDVYLVAKSE